MNSRAFLLATLLVSPAWSQEPAAEAPVPGAASFDLRSDALKKIVRETAASQFSYVRESDEAPAAAKPHQVVYVTPEKPAPVSEPPRRLPDPAPSSDGFLSSMFEILIDEALGSEGDEYDDVTFSNDMLRCRVQKEIKTAPPGVDNCPSAD